MASYLLAAASPPGAPVWAVQPLPLDAGPTAVLAAGAAGELRLLAPLPSGSAACLATHAHSSNGASSSNGDAGSSSSSSAGSGIGVFAVAVAGERVLSVAADGSVALWQLDLAAVAQAAERAAALEAQPDSAESASPSSSDAPLLRALAAVPTLAPHLEAHAVALHPTQPLLAAVGAGPRVALCSAAPEDFGALQRMCDAPNAQAGASRGGKGASTEMATCVAFVSRLGEGHVPGSINRRSRSLMHAGCYRARAVSCSRRARPLASCWCMLSPRDVCWRRLQVRA
jgi:hypothetical protein